MPWPLRVQRTVYTQYVHLFTTPSHPHPTHADCPHSQRNPALPCASFTLSCVSVCFRNIHTTRPCDLRRHAPCAARSPVNHWPARRRNDVAVAVAPTGVTQGHRKLSHQSGTHDFLLTFHSKHRPISHRFRDKRRCTSKIAQKSPFFPPPRVFNAPAEGVTLRIWYRRKGS